MKESLASKYRPKSFSEMIGQPLTAVVLSRMVEAGEVPDGLLFSGPSGTGKTSAARVLAAELNGSADDLSVIEVDAASNGGVADVRSLIESLRYSSGSKHRIVIYDEAHSMSRDAFNALLKTLENPPTGTIFVMVTTEPEKIPETVQTRLTEFQFYRVSPGDIVTRLGKIAKAENIEASPELLSILTERASGNVRTAITSLDQVSRAQITTADEFTSFLRETDTAPVLFSALLTGDPAKFYAAFDEIMLSVGNASVVAAQLSKLIRDLYVLKAGGTLQLSGTRAQARSNIAQRVDTDRLFMASRILWDLKTRIRVSDDPRGNLEIALMLIAEAITRGKTPVATAPVGSPVTTSEPPKAAPEPP